MIRPFSAAPISRAATHKIRNVFEVDFPLRTERLILRPFSVGDFDAVYELQSSPEITRYLPYGVRDDGEVRQALAKKVEQTVFHEGEGALSVAIELAESGRLIGEVLLFGHSAEHRSAEIGYVFHPDYGGKGYATEAAAEVLRLAFEEFGRHRVIGRLDARNTASARVLERLGMRREAHFVQNELFKGEWSDELVYAILDHEWRELKG